jgi:flagellar biosynthesis chaperone FliJ
MRRAYRYPLQALENLRGADVDAARAALHLVAQEIVANESDIHACSASMRQLEQELREARSSGQFDLDQQRASYSYLSHLRLRLAMLQQARAELLQREQASLQQINAARSALRTLEKHHARLGDAYFLEAARAGQREADDNWLARAGEREAAP